MVVPVRGLALALLLPVHGNADAHPGDRPAGLRQHLHRDTWHIRLREHVLQLLRVVEEPRQGPHRHVAGHPGVAFEIDRPHSGSVLLSIIPAMCPAPNPLSMFTTLTLEEQESIIDSSAVTPPKDAP